MQIVISVGLRVLRHLLLPVAVWLVSAGILPPDITADFVEAAIVVIAGAAALLWSYLREIRIRGRAVKDHFDGPA